MRQHRVAFAGTVIAIMALGGVVSAQTPRQPGEPLRSPGEVVPFQEERKGPPRSDAYRVVGKVLAVDRAKGAMDRSGVGRHAWDASGLHRSLFTRS